MGYEQDRDDYRLRVLIERMQREGRSEGDIEAAVRAASVRIDREQRRPSGRPNRLRLLGRRLRTR